MRKFVNIIFVTLFAVLISGCLDKPDTPTLEKQSTLLRNAININNLSLLADASSIPFIVTKQEWETADDGYGFVLGEKSTLLASNAKELNDVLKILEPIKIEGEEPIKQQFTVSDFTEEFNSIDEHWKSLDIIVFLRGQSDVEHIVILGFDKESLKLRAIYFN